MERFSKQCEFLDALNQELSNAKSQYEKDKIELYSILKEKISVIKSYIIAHNIGNDEAFDQAMRIATKGMNISVESLHKLYDDPEIISLLFKNGIYTNETFSSIVYILNFLIFSVISFLVIYSLCHENVSTFLWLFLFVSIAVALFLGVMGCPFKFNHTHINRK